MEDHTRKPSEERNDVDLGTIITATSKGLKKLGSAINSFFIHIGEILLFFLIFLKKRIIWILLSAIVGFAYGSFLSYSNGNKYYSSLTARFNFGSSRALYNTVDYFNALIAEGRWQGLGKILSISEKDAATLVEFVASPIKDEMILTDLYKEQFFDVNQNLRVRTDTFWTKTVTYEEFKNGLTKYDIPLQKLTVTSTLANVFPKIQAGLVKNITSDGILLNNYRILQKTQEDEERIIVASLKGLDTLRTVYNERLRQPGVGESSLTNLTVLDQSQIRPSPELELYERVLMLKDELKLLRKSNVNNQEIVQVLASFNSVGQRVGVLKQSAAKYAFRTVVAALLIFIMLEVYKALDAYEKKQSKGPSL